jgi:serine---pyruvate transaminase
MEKEPFSTDRLFCPGPTPKHCNSNGLNSDIYHRSSEFCELFKNTASLLKKMIGSHEAPLILTSSGTGAMEAAIVNFTNEGDEVLVVNGGKFGERWLKINEAYGNKVHSLDLDWGSSPTVEAVVKLAKAAPSAKAFFIQANETSTGVHYPLAELINAVRSEFRGLIIVDAISSIGAHESNMQADGIDVLIGGSQKGFGVAPGLAFLAASENAWSSISNRPRFYFDLRKEKKGQAQGKSAFTPAISLVQDLHQALTQMNDLGFENVTAHHSNQANACRSAIEAMGLEMFSINNHSNALTAFKVPTDVDGLELLSYLRKKFGFFYAGGQDHLKGKIIRISHLGFVNRFDLLDGIAGLEFGLNALGHKTEIGLGIKAAVNALAK